MAHRIAREVRVAFLAGSLVLAGCGVTFPWSSGSEPGPGSSVPNFSVSPTTLTFTAPLAGPNPPVQHVVLFNENTGFDVLVQSDPTVFSVSPNPATPVPGQGLGFDVAVQPPSQLTAGTFTGDVRFVPCARPLCTVALSAPPALVVAVTYVVTP